MVDTHIDVQDMIEDFLLNPRDVYLLIGLEYRNGKFGGKITLTTNVTEKSEVLRCLEVTRMHFDRDGVTLDLK